jgi:hypothetical protein
VFAVTAGVQLAGLTPDAFAQESVTNAFLTTAASSMGVAPSSVAITGVSVVSSSATRRSLVQTTAALQVDYQVYLLTAAAASGVASRITASGGPSLAALQSAGVPATGVVLTTPPVVVAIPAPPAPPSPAPPPPAPPPPAGCGISWFCFSGVACAGASSCGSCPVGMAGDGVTCAPCTPRVAITPSFPGSSSSRSVDAQLSGIVRVPEASCNTTGGFAFSWVHNATDAAGTLLTLPPLAATRPTLELPARSLGANQTAEFTLTACFAGARATCCVTSFAFAVTPSPLVALIGGGSGVVGETPLSLSAAASSDPDGAPLAALSFAWACARTDAGRVSDVCAARDGTPVALGAGVTQSMQLAGDGGASGGATYVVTLTVSLGGRTATTDTTLTVLPGALPLVSIAGSAVLSGQAKADPGQQLVMRALATAFVPGAVTTRWAVVAQSVPGPLLNLSAVSSTPVTSASMVLRPFALAAGAQYTFTLTATDAVGAIGSANATVVTSAPPAGGWADVSPQSGVALSTQFTITAAGWTAPEDELPLSYSADFFVDGSDAPATSLTAGGFQDSPVISAQLPAGLEAAGNIITLRLTVRSAFGASTSSNASVAVTWPVFSGAAEVGAFVDDATARASAALDSGDASSALQVVGGLAALLNAQESAPAGGGTGGGSSNAAAAEQRASLLAIVASAVSQSSSMTAAPASIDSTASLVATLVSSPAQLSGSGTSSALQVLSAIASAGVAVSASAAQSVASALTSVVMAPTQSSSSGGSGGGGGGGGGTSSSSAGVGASVLTVLTSLASSQASGMSVPGQAAATVSTPQIQMYVELASSGADSTLFTAPLSAPARHSTRCLPVRWLRRRANR